MATTPETQSVPTPTPVLSASLIRQYLNPTPGPGAPAGIIREWGYLDAMLDAALFDDILDDEIEMDEQAFIRLALSALDYVGCDWYAIEWDAKGALALLDLIDTLNP